MSSILKILAASLRMVSKKLLPLLKNAVRILPTAFIHIDFVRAVRFQCSP